VQMWKCMLARELSIIRGIIIYRWQTFSCSNRWFRLLFFFLGENSSYLTRCSSEKKSLLEFPKFISHLRIRKKKFQLFPICSPVIFILIQMSTNSKGQLFFSLDRKRRKKEQLYKRNLTSTATTYPQPVLTGKKKKI
jgi:hypothetical protein